MLGTSLNHAASTLVQWLMTYQYTCRAAVTSILLNWCDVGFIYNGLSSSHITRLKSNFDCASGSAESPSNIGPHISVLAAARAISNVSVPEHMAKRKPPPAQK